MAEQTIPKKTIIIVGGRRIGPSTSQSAFPAQSIPRVKSEIAHAIRAQKPALLVTSAACGFDLLCIDAARELAIPIRVVLPFDIDAFRASSVSDCGADWEAMFDSFLRHDVKHTAIEVLYAPGPSAVENRDAQYAAALERMLSISQDYSEAGNEVVALVGWNGVSHGETDLTARLISHATAQRWRITEIRTTLVEPSRQ